MNKKDFITQEIKIAWKKRGTLNKNQDKLHSCQIENQLLREETKNKQKTIETILNQNNELLKFNHFFDQGKMENIKSTNAKKKEMTAKQMVTNKLQD